MADAYLSAVGRKAALTRWDREPDRVAATRCMRDGFLAKLRAQVLEEFPALTDEAEIENRVQRKLKIHQEGMRAASLKARQAKAAERRQAQTEALLNAIDAEGAA